MSKLGNEKLETRQEILKRTLAAIKKDNPEISCNRYGDSNGDADVQFISTGSLAVDNAIGGGFAKGRIIELVGLPSSGKTTLALTAIANLQKEDPNAGIMYVDAEAAIDPKYAKALGVNMDDVILCQPDNGEQGYKAVETYMNSGLADIVVIDSIPAMLPTSLLNRDYGDDAQPGRHAALTTTAISRITQLAKKFGVTVILINQYKPMVKISQYQATGGSTMGSWYTPGGNQLLFFVSQFLEIKKSGEIKVGGELKSNVITMTCKKNKVYVPYKTCDFVITYGKGLDREQELVGLGLTLGVINQAGAFYSIPELSDQRWQGRNNLGEAISTDAELAKKLENLIKSKIQGANEIKLSKDEEVDNNIELNKNVEE